MLRYMTDRARPGLVALYDIRPGNGVDQFLQPRTGARTGLERDKKHTNTEFLPKSGNFSYFRAAFPTLRQLR